MVSWSAIQTKVKEMKQKLLKCRNFFPSKQKGGKPMGYTNKRKKKGENKSESDMNLKLLCNVHTSA